MKVENLRPRGAAWMLRLHEKGGTLEHAQAMAAHESPRTTKLYDRTKERLTQDKVKRNGKAVRHGSRSEHAWYAVHGSKGVATV